MGYADCVAVFLRIGKSITVAFENAVILSAAKDIHRDRARFFAALRMTDERTRQTFLAVTKRRKCRLGLKKAPFGSWYILPLRLLENPVDPSASDEPAESAETEDE